MQIKLTDNIKYVGMDDLDIDLFEGMYEVPDGVSYNSYLILDEKTVLLDTVDKEKMMEWVEKLETELEGRNLDYLVIHHVEPDHTGSVAKVLELFPEVTVVGNQKTFLFLSQFWDEDRIKNKLIVKEGDVLELGEHRLTFYMAPMVHWPEVMVSYESKEKILFSADAFGKFGALSETKNEEWVCEARRYYFNIVGKYGVSVQALLKKASALEIKMICPLHGPVLNENLEEVIKLYDKWSRYEPEDSAVLIVFASIHGNTAEAAKQFAELLREREERSVVIDLARTDMSKAIEDAFRYDRMVLAAASYDGGVFPKMREFLLRLQGKNYQNRKIGMIENGTWSPSAGRTMKEILDTMKKIELAEPMVTLYYSMKKTDIASLEALADNICSKR